MNRKQKYFVAGPDECDTGVALTKAIDAVLAEDVHSDPPPEASSTPSRATAPPSGFAPAAPGGGASLPQDVETIRITLDLPFPPSANRLTSHSRQKPYRPKKYLDWENAADMYVLSTRQFPKRKIHGPFRTTIRLNRDLRGRSDGDNRVKAVLDWCQSREIIRNDRDCESGFWMWVDPDDAPQGCRITLWSIPDAVQ